jgi:hypothetical protein
VSLPEQLVKNSWGSANDVVVYSVGLVNASVCCPAEMPVDDVADAVNIAHPTGLSHGWVPSTETTFSGGEPHPCPCEHTPERVHRLFHC